MSAEQDRAKIAEVMARALCLYSCCMDTTDARQVASMAPYVDGNWPNYRGQAALALAAIPAAMGLDAEGLNHCGFQLDAAGRAFDVAGLLPERVYVGARLLRALAAGGAA